MVEEGQPEYIEQALHKVLRTADIPTKIYRQGRICRWPANIPRR